MQPRILFKNGSVVNFPDQYGSDVVYINSHSNLYLLCDGANGCRHGREAAIWLTRYLGENLAGGWDSSNSEQVIKQYIFQANEYMISNFVEGCSTLAGLYFSKQTIFSFTVGDSYLHRFEYDGKRWFHSSLSHRDIDDCGNPSQLLGSEALSTIHLSQHSLDPLQLFILLSDGIGNCVESAVLEEILNVAIDLKSLTSVAQQLAEIAGSRGSTDDKSSLIVLASCQGI